jgi:hypothetical protein
MILKYAPDGDLQNAEFIEQTSEKMSLTFLYVVKSLDKIENYFFFFLRAAC